MPELISSSGGHIYISKIKVSAIITAMVIILLRNAKIKKRLRTFLQ